MYKKIFIFILCLTCSACATKASHENIPGYEQKVAAYHLSKRDLEEIKVGTSIHSNILTYFSVYYDDAVIAYVNGIGESLLPYVERKGLPYQFTILHDERIYATVAPGGYLYITTGMIHFVANEAELAAVIAHELGRAQYRNPNYSESKEFFEGLSQGSMMLGPAFGPYGTLAAVGIRAMNTFMFTEKMLEQRVTMADECALSYLTYANYDPQGLIDVMYRILNSPQEMKAYLFHYLTSHPISINRMNALNTYFSRLMLDGKSFNVNRERFLEKTQSVAALYTQK